MSENQREFAKSVSRRGAFIVVLFLLEGAGISLIFAYYPLSVRHRNIDDPSQVPASSRGPEKVIYCRKQFANKKEIMINFSLS